jgi:large subunit ribosomal protein L11
MQIKLLVEGGDMQPGPALSQKLGPAGINPGSVIQKVNEATKNFKGMKVPVEVDVDVSTKEIEVKVFSPPIAELIKKELGVEKGSGLQKKTKIANASIEQIISISKTKLPNLLSKDLKAAVKSVIGSCITLGIIIESKDPKEVIREINEGKYDKEILGEITETPPEKKVALDSYFAKLKEEQDKIKQQEEAAKAAEAAAAEAVAKPGEAKPAEATKAPEEKKKEKK